MPFLDKPGNVVCTLPFALDPVPDGADPDADFVAVPLLVDTIVTVFPPTVSVMVRTESESLNSASPAVVYL